MTVDEAVSIESALESMHDGFTLKQHVDCYKAEFQAEAISAWAAASTLVQQFGTVRKALNHVETVIESHR